MLTESELRRFEASFTRKGPTECWPWHGEKTKDGYGRFFYRGKRVVAHRVAFEEYVGSIPDGLKICHACDVPGCVNPACLFAGTQRENVRDCIAKGRFNARFRVRPERRARGSRHGWTLHPEALPRGEDSGGARVTEAVVRAIRREYVPKYGSLAALSKKYGIGTSQVRRIALRESWAHVE